MIMQELKETFTRDQVDLIAKISTIIGEEPNTYQGNSVYQDNVEIDLDLKNINYTVDFSFTDDRNYYTIAGIALLHDYEIQEFLNTENSFK